MGRPSGKRWKAEHVLNGVFDNMGKMRGVWGCRAVGGNG